MDARESGTKPMSPYMQFAAGEQAKVVRDFTAAHGRQPRFEEVGKLLGERWQAVSAAKRHQEALAKAMNEPKRTKRRKVKQRPIIEVPWPIILAFAGWHSALALCNRALLELAGIPLRKTPWITEQAEDFRGTVCFLHENIVWRAKIQASHDVYDSCGMPDCCRALVKFVNGKRKLEAVHSVDSGSTRYEDALLCSRTIRKFYDSLCQCVQRIDPELFRRLAYKTFERFS
jgi:hypothetical protein